MTELHARLAFKWALKRLIDDGWHYSAAIFIAAQKADQIRAKRRAPSS